MREVRIVITCDWCKEEVDENEVGEIRVSIGTQTYEGDGCGVCIGRMTHLMRPVVKRRTRKKTT